MVSEPLPVDEGAGENTPGSPFAYTDKFNEVFPYYLAIGMTYEQFWEQDCELVKYYRKAMKIRQELSNQQAWLQGLYVYEAIADLTPILHAFAKKGSKPKPYPSKPFEFSETKEKKKERTEKANAKAYAYMQALMGSVNRKFAKDGDSP